MSHEVVRTRGGALAMRCQVAGEVMHPGVGPLAEAQSLYVAQSRLVERVREAGERPLVLFDVGLGAASNAISARAAIEGAFSSEPAGQGRPRLEIISFERDLGALALALEHGEAFGLTGESARAARALLNDGVADGAVTRWRLVAGDLRETLATVDARGDVVFWDPFSPRANPELWTVAAFADMRRAAGPRCTLYTYSASTATRTALLLAGWAVGIGAPIGDKAETTTAAVEAADLERPLDRAWLRRVARADAPRPVDAPADAAVKVAEAPQFAEPHQSSRA